MAKPNYQFEKRQRDLAKKRKQEEKRQRKLAAKVRADDGSPEASAVPPVTNADDPGETTETISPPQGESTVTK